MTLGIVHFYYLFVIIHSYLTAENKNWAPIDSNIKMHMTVYKKKHTSETLFSDIFRMPRFPLFHMVLGTEGKARITEGKPKG